jgi:hypothetical protein
MISPERCGQVRRQRRGCGRERYLDVDVLVAAEPLLAPAQEGFPFRRLRLVAGPEDVAPAAGRLVVTAEVRLVVAGGLVGDAPPVGLVVDADPAPVAGGLGAVARSPDGAHSWILLKHICRHACNAFKMSTLNL